LIVKPSRGPDVDDSSRNSAARRLAIQRQLLLDGTASVEALARRLGVSVATIRRDLNAMDREGAVRRTHGGAVVERARGADQAFAMREQMDAAAKRAIAQEAMKHLRPDQTVLMNDGSTLLAVARELVAADFPLTAITAGVNIATTLAERNSIAVYLLGGRLRHLTLGTSGAFAERMLGEFNADMAFLSVEGISAREGVMFSYEADASLAGLMVKRASRTIVLATARKLETIDRIRACPISSVDTLITDSQDEAVLRAFAAAGVQVVAARAGT
jgi:DeoR/GlpR family transcriptional regulator of sugar metabolism